MDGTIESHQKIMIIKIPGHLFNAYGLYKRDHLEESCLDHQDLFVKGEDVEYGRMYLLGD